jgi:hypothetical protein
MHLNKLALIVNLKNQVETQILQKDQDSFCPGAEVQGFSVGGLFFDAR